MGKVTRSILLVGREGNGKSSCIKSINQAQSFLGRKDIVALECQGVGDTGLDAKENINIVLRRVRDQMKMCENQNGGFDAIVLVLKYGVRYTKQEKDAVAMTKSIFGEEEFQKRGVLLFTNGDNFEANDDSFEKWCKEQTGDIQALFREVQNRYVLFNNKTLDRAKLEKQCQLLKSVTGSIYIKGNVDKYRLHDFDKIHNYTHFSVIFTLLIFLLSIIQRIAFRIISLLKKTLTALLNIALAILSSWPMSLFSSVDKWKKLFLNYKESLRHKE